MEDRQIKYLSDTHEGKKHDKKIGDEDGIRTPEGSELYRDTGYQGHAMEGVKIYQPKKKPRGGVMLQWSQIPSKENIMGKLMQTRNSIRARIENLLGIQMQGIQMQTRNSIRARIENLLGIQISRASHHGHRVCTDIKRSGCQISVVFDVGANVGQSALKFRVAFPKAKIYCFEPVKETFEILKGNVNSYDTISCYQTAFGSSDGQETIYLSHRSNTSSLIKPKKIVGSEVVDLCTVDGFASDNQIKRIDLLKIDTEGFDLEVLKGAQNMLSSGQIAFVLAEIGFHPGNTRHVPFDDIRSYLLSMGYAVFGIYDQQPEWSGEKRLRYANVCFSNDRNSGPEKG